MHTFFVLQILFPVTKIACCKIQSFEIQIYDFLFDVFSTDLYLDEAFKLDEALLSLS